MANRLFKLFFIFSCLLIALGTTAYCFSPLYASETVTTEWDTITLIQKSKSALKHYLKRPYKVFRGDTMPGEMIGEHFTYIIKRGDTLVKIAVKFDVSYMAIVSVNDIKNPAMIHTGKKLLIPKRVIVPKNIGKGVLINLPEYRLYLFEDSIPIRVYPICIGLTTWKTLQGKFKIRDKTINPSWQIPEEMAERLMIKQELVPPGDTNPLGDRWIGLSLPNTGIHSTIDTMSIGRTSSHGCIRLYPVDIHELYDLVKKGDTGEIIYEPIKIAVVGPKIFMEVHRDIYRLVPGMENEAIRRLEYLGLLDLVDIEKVRGVVRERRGVPIMVGTRIKEDSETMQ